MDYKNYKKSRDSAWQILIDLKIWALPVKVSEICKELNITAKYYTSIDDNDGISFIESDRAYICISSQTPLCRQRFTAAHELGHIILGHTGKFELVCREPNSSDNEIEHSANVFASRLLAPACVLWGIGVQTTEEIAKICNISLISAEFRMQRMKELSIRNKFLTSPLEKQVFEQFKDFINKNKI